MQRLYCYERPRDGQRIEIFQGERRGADVYVIREGGDHDTVTTDRSEVDTYRFSLAARGFVSRT